MAEKKSIMNLLREIADMMEYKGENSFKISAYRNGAIAIRRCEEDLDELIRTQKLDSIKGIGKGLQSVIYEYCTTGKSSLHEELRKDVPDGIEQLIRIKGLTPKKIKTLYETLSISSIGELEYACRENRLGLLKGFGIAAQEKILKEIENMRKFSSLILLSTGHAFAEEISVKLANITSVLRKQLTGELRRGMEIISHIEFVVLVSEVSTFLSELAEKLNYEVQGMAVKLKEYAEVPVTLHLALTLEDYTDKVFSTTGSDEFIEMVKAHKKNLTRETSEEAMFKKLKISYIIPEMREHGQFNLKQHKNSDLEIGLFKGFLHFHSTWSDGRNTLTEMISAASEKGYLYAAVCDHSKQAFYANGLDEERILLQYKEIGKLAKSQTIKIIQGIESDILQDGSLDYSSDFLSHFALVVASIHSRFKMDEKEMTGRMLKAIENPYTDILAHPSGRLLLSREPYKFNVEKIIDACAANDVAIEINSNPRRLDIDWRYINYARDKGCRFSINSDAHSIDEIDLVKYGVIMGRKGGLQTSEIINCYSPEEFYNFVNRKVSRKNLW